MNDHAVMFTQEFWDERYDTRPQIWSGNPNAQLVAEASALTPGTALDVGCGEGADAIWLAARGWQVTAIDVSPVALERGATRAAQEGVAEQIAWEQRDVLTWGPEADGFDLVSAQFMHLPPEPRERLFTRLAAAVRPRGTLLVVAHDASDHHTTMPRTPAVELFYSATEAAATLDRERFEVVVEEARPRSATDPAGRDVQIHDAVLVARRRS